MDDPGDDEKADVGGGFGSQLRRRRREQGLSLAGLAQRVNYSKAYLSRIESGARTANPALARACDAALGADGHLAAHLTPPLPLPVLPGSRPAQLPAATSGFAGREAELSRLDEVYRQSVDTDAATVMLLTGTAGVGKTTLMVRWAHRVRQAYPDGELFADLHGFGDLPATEPNDVLGRFLRALGTPTGRIPATGDERVALYRSLLDGRRMLIVLDNAVSAKQVRPLLPGTSTCLTIVSSRASLSGLVARDGAVRIAVPAMGEDESVAVLAQSVGAGRVASERGHAARVASLCAGLPLALRIVGERAVRRPEMRLSDLADELNNEGRRLALLATDDDDTAVRAVFAASYDKLPMDAARVFRLLALHPGVDVDMPAITALAGGECEPAVRTLTGGHLLTEDAAGRYHRHDLLRLYAIERLHAEEAPSTCRAATQRLIEHYLSTAEAAEHVLIPNRPSVSSVPSTGRFNDYAHALAWFEAELDNLVAVCGVAHQHGYDPAGWQLPAALSAFCLHTKRWDEWIATHQMGLACARRGGDRTAEARMLSSLGAAYGDRGDYQRSRDHLMEALAIRRNIGDPVPMAHTLNNLAQTQRRCGETDTAIQLFTEAQELFRTAKDGYGLGSCLTNLGEALIELGDLPSAARSLTEAMAIHHSSGDRYGEVMALDSLGRCYHEQGMLKDALHALHSALAGRRELGDRHGEAYTRWRLGDVRASLREPAAAAAHWHAALRIFEELRAPEADHIRPQLHKDARE